MKPLHFAFVLFSFPAFLSADSTGEIQIITLKDTSVIRAKVIDDAGGFFLIKSPALGEIKIRSTDILSIKQTNPQSAILPSTALSSSASEVAFPEKTEAAGEQSALAAKVQGFIASGSGGGAVAQLAKNPAIMKAVVSDPNVMKAIQSGDTAALRESPAVKQLLSDPQTKSLIKSFLNMNGSPKGNALGQDVPR